MNAQVEYLWFIVNLISPIICAVVGVAVAFLTTSIRVRWILFVETLLIVQSISPISFSYDYYDYVMGIVIVSLFVAIITRIIRHMKRMKLVAIISFVIVIVMSQLVYVLGALGGMPNYWNGIVVESISGYDIKMKNPSGALNHNKIYELVKTYGIIEYSYGAKNTGERYYDCDLKFEVNTQNDKLTWKMLNNGSEIED